MKRTALIVLVLLLTTGAAFGQVRATVESVEGKVELRPEGGGWQAAEAGQRIARGTTISTGFNSGARLRLADSLLQVEALTRMTLEDLVETSDTVSTDVFVRVGRTRASVQSAEGVESDFTMRSPITTAAVRGTDFTFDTKKTEVTDGTVTVANFIGRSTSVAEGGSAVIEEFGSLQDARDTFLGASSVDPDPTPTGDDDDGDDGGPPAGGTTGGATPSFAPVRITIDWE